MTQPLPDTPWSSILELLQAEFHRLDSAKLRSCAQDWPSIVAHFAQTHDLTFDEAADTLEDWLDRRVQRDGAIAA